MEFGVVGEFALAILDTLGRGGGGRRKSFSDAREETSSDVGFVDASETFSGGSKIDRCVTNATTAKTSAPVASAIVPVDCQSPKLRHQRSLAVPTSAASVGST